ncbi:ferredoxin III, nif-specific [Sessilibacter corallicola]|uniref:ferredoxin III, nif-specific n=1 Tax=Sessilibacter corallicola TaxID=2904075 RepID=UPI001E31B10C|nr:ferredoxin III, nif-specific [Sessilibacter corallicola]MCE2029638.1 ferredoxin III, nif-specific [Sessilibacter corallicola]
MTATIVGKTRGGTQWVPEFVTELNANTCIGCGRCYKVCPRDVFELVDKSDLVDVDDEYDEDDYDDDDELKVMAIKDALDCIGCKSCSRVCPKNCHTHEQAAA